MNSVSVLPHIILGKPFFLKGYYMISGIFSQHISDRFDDECANSHGARTIGILDPFIIMQFLEHGLIIEIVIKIIDDNKK